MSLRVTISCLAVLLVCALAVPATAAEAGSSPVQFLTQTPSNAAPVDVGMAYLRSARTDFGLTAADLKTLHVKNQVRSERSGITHVYLRQKLGGLEVANAISNFNVAADGRMISVGDRFVSDLASKVNTFTPKLDARQAILSAAEGLGLQPRGDLKPLRVDLQGPTRSSVWTGAGLSTEDIPAKLALYQVSEDSVRLTWDLVIQEPSGRHWWNLFVDAVTGDLVGQYDWIDWDTYEVFEIPKESPLDGPRTVQINPADVVASPFGWHDVDGNSGPEFTDTRGNNVSAQEDRDANNVGGFRPDGGPGLDFLFPLNLATQQPVDYQAAAITNLFYWNNVIHDVLYHYGFDEAAGNFQENNYGRGNPGIVSASDSVNADAQDGSGVNNANFGTPPDGFNPRMQMFEWLPASNSTVRVTAPASIAADYGAAEALFGAPLPAAGIPGTLELVDDATGTPSDGCTALVGFTPGNIAVIDRGACQFGTKVLNAENAGAIAAIVVNNAGDGLINMAPGTEGGLVTISSVFIGQSDGATIKGELPGVTAILLPIAAAPNRDSDFDNGVIAHEYAHGVSNRLTGGAHTVNCLFGPQQAGEGWSDWFGLWFTAKAGDTGPQPRGIGNYVTFQPANGPGIRRFPYSTDLNVNPDTYATIAGVSVPHGVGSVWAAMLWEVYWGLVDDHGFDPDLYAGTGGNNLAMQLVMDGMKIQPCDPTFVDARDAILLADQALTDGENQCTIWIAFAKRGLGLLAFDGGSPQTRNVIQDFTVPNSCAGLPGSGLPGSPCALDADCASGLCSQGRVCG